MSSGFGNDPEYRSLTLTLGADFTSIIDAPPGEPFEAGMSACIKFFADPRSTTVIDTWDAAVTPEKVQWHIESETADLIPIRTYYRVYALYTDDPELDDCWFCGWVTRK